MRKTFLLALAASFFCLSALPAYANHATEDYFSQRWLKGVSRGYCIEDFAGPLTDGEYSNMKITTAHQMNFEIETVPNVTTDWATIPGIECSSNLEFSEWNCVTLQFSYPNITSRISLDNLGTNEHGATKKCDLDGNGNLDFFWVAINDCQYTAENCTGFDLHWDYSTSVPFGDYDYAGIVLHEMVHGIGWSGHWTSNGGMCPISSGIQTMCTGTDHGTKSDGNSSGEYWSTLGTHDIGEITQGYA